MSSPAALPPLLPLAVPAYSATTRGLYWGHLRKRWWVYFFGIGSMIVTNCMEVAIPRCMQAFVDILQGHPVEFGGKEYALDFTSVYVLLLLILIVQAVSRRYWRVTLGRETPQVGGLLKATLWERARYFPLRRIEEDLSIGVVMNAATSDVTSARNVFGWSFIGFTDCVFLVGLSLLSMGSIDLKLTLAALMIAPLVPFLVGILARREYHLHQEAQTALGDLNDICAQAVSTAKLQRLTNSFPFWQQKLVDAAARYRTQRGKVLTTALHFIIITGLSPLFSFSIILSLGVHRVLEGSLSVGEFVAMQSYVLVLQYPLSEFGFILADWQRGFASLSRLSHLFRTSPEPGIMHGVLKEVHPTEHAPALAIRDLVFTHRDSKEPIIEIPDLTIARGERLGIRGPIGSGKSTFVRIIAGLERGYAGSVALWGRDLSHYSHEALRHAISVVPQQPFLFADTIRNNLLLDRDMDEAEMWRALEAASIADEVRNFPMGLQTGLGEWGINLSGGQKQRLTIARALLRKPQILIFDDCLSAVDTLTEDRILQALDTHLGDTTLIWTAHRQSTLRLCNRIIDLDV